MGGRVRALGLIALTVAALTPATAGAFSMSGFKAERQGGRVAWHIITCGLRGYRVSFQMLLERDSGSPRYVRRGSFVQQRGCEGWEIYVEDIWTGGLWDTQMTVFSHGETHRTGWIVFDNGEEE
jgi:hypothetical protein